MKIKRKILGRILTLVAVVSVVLIGHAINECVESLTYGPWSCDAPPTLNSAGTLNGPTTINICVDGTVTPPTIGTPPTFNNGTKKRTLDYHCQADVLQYASVLYTPGTLSFVPNGGAPPINSTFSTPGTYTYAVKVSAVPTSLVGWWPGNNNANDLVLGHNGNPPGTPPYTFDSSGKVGAAFQFDGNGDAVPLGNPIELRLQNFTIETWIKRSSTTKSTMAGVNTVFLSYGIAGYGFGMFDDGRLYLTQVGINHVPLSTPVITDLNWHHVAVTKNGSTVKFYVDGVAYTAAPYNVHFQFNTPIAIGARGDNYGNSFLGKIDEMAVYDCILSDSQIAAIYTAGSSGKCWPPSGTCILPSSCICSPVTGISLNQTVTVNVYAKPAISLSASTFNYVKGALPTIIDNTANSSGPWTGAGTLTIGFAADTGVVSDRLAIRNQSPITISGPTVSFSGTPIGTFSGGLGAPLVVALNSSATDAAVDELLKSITYELDMTSPCRPAVTRTLNYTLANTGTGCSSPSATKTLTIGCPVLEVMVVLDKSGSMDQGGSTKFADAKAAAAYFVTLLNMQVTGGPTIPNPDKAALVPFCEDASVTQSLTTSENSMISAINALTSTCGGTDINEAVQDAHAHLTANHTAPNRQVIVLLTDGDYTAGGDPVPAANAAKAANIHVITIGLQVTSTAETVLQNMASYKNDVSGPKDYYYVGSGGSLNVTYEQIAQSLCADPNQAPKVDFVATSATYVENAAPVVLDSGFTVNDTEDNLKGGTMTFTITANGHSTDDRLSVANLSPLSISGNQINYSGHLVATYGWSYPTLTITLDGTWGTVAAAQEIGRKVTYNNVSDDPTTGTRTVQVGASDGDGGCNNGVSAPDTIQVIVTSVNDAPTLNAISDITVPAGPQTVNLAGISTGGENQTLTVSATTDNPNLIKLLAVNYTSPNNSGTLTFTTPQASGVAHITVTVQDNGGTANGGVNTSPARTFTVTVQGVVLSVNAGPDQMVVLPAYASLSGDSTAYYPSMELWSELNGGGAPTSANLVPGGAVYNASHNYIVGGLTIGDPYIVIFGGNETGSAVDGPTQIVSPGTGKQIFVTAHTTGLVFFSPTVGAPVTAQVYRRAGVHFADDPAFPGNPRKKRATFDAPGLYQIQFQGSDCPVMQPCVTASDIMQVTALENHAPIVNAGPDRRIAPSGTAQLSGMAVDDGVPGGALSYKWTATLLPAGASTPTFADTLPVTTVVLTTEGLYKFKLKATEAGPGLFGEDEMEVIVTSGISRTYTRNVDFEEGILVGLNYDDVPNQLQMNKNPAPFAYVNVAASAKGTILRIDADTGQIIGDYATTPSYNAFNRYGAYGDPSRTTVDRFGNVWVANRNGDAYLGGSIARVGVIIGGTRGNKVNGVFQPDPAGAYLQPPFKYNTCVDRDGDGLIKTSTKRGEILHWRQHHTGKIFVAYNAQLFANGFLGNDDLEMSTTNLAMNIADWFSDKSHASFLVYANHAGLTGSQLKQVMERQHSWKISTTETFTTQNLAKYDAIFVSDVAVDNAVLIQYVKNGGCVYVAAGTGTSGADALADANRWNPFLNHFGLGLETTYNPFEGLAGAPTGERPFDSGMWSYLNFHRGNSIVTTPGTGTRNRRIYSHVHTDSNYYPVFGIYDPSGPYGQDNGGRIIVSKSHAAFQDANWIPGLQDPTFVVSSFRNPLALINDFKAAADNVSAYLMNTRFSAATVQAINDYPDVNPDFAAVRDAIMGDFNTIIAGASIYDATRFSGVTLRHATEQLRVQNPTSGPDLVRLNRMLLEDAYPTRLYKIKNVDADQFAVNVRHWIVKKFENAKLLCYSYQSTLDGAYLADTMENHEAFGDPSLNTWVVNPSASIAFTDLLQYDGIFLGGIPSGWTAAKTQALIEYVKSGGGVFLAGGSGVSDTADATQWNAFLNAFGMQFDNFYTGDSGPVTITRQLHCNINGCWYDDSPVNVPIEHQALSIVEAIHFEDGTDIRKLSTEPHSRILMFQSDVMPNELGVGRIAAYQWVGDASTAEDEAIINYAHVIPNTRPRALAIDKNNNVWIGSTIGGQEGSGQFTGYYEMVDGATGLPIANTAFRMVGGGYGALIDKQGVLWSAMGATRFKPTDRFNFNTTPPTIINENAKGDSTAGGGYGIGIDPLSGDIWGNYATFFGSGVTRLSADDWQQGIPQNDWDNPFGATSTGGYAGMVVSKTGDVWVGGYPLGHLFYDSVLGTGTFLGDVPLPCGADAKGVTLDSNGKVWAVSTGSTATRVNPEAGKVVTVDGRKHFVGEVDLEVDLGADAGAYNYSDMSGYVTMSSTIPSAIWNVVHEAPSSVTWVRAIWTRENPVNAGTITVDVRAASTREGLASALFQQVTSISAGTVAGDGMRYTGTLPAGITGKFIEIRVVLIRSDTGVSPMMKDFTISSSTVPMVTENIPLFAQDDKARVLRDSVNNELNVLGNDTPAAGTTLEITGVSAPRFGRIEIINSGTKLRYTPNAHVYGEDRFVYTVIDHQGGVEHGLVEVDIASEGPAAKPPIARDDVVSVRQNSVEYPLTVLANDNDPAGDTLRVVSVSKPMHGTVKIDSCTKILYTPTPGYSGPDEVHYTVENFKRLQAQATVAITVLPDSVLPCDTVVVDRVDLGSAQYFYPAQGMYNVRRFKVTGQGQTVNFWARSPDSYPGLFLLDASGTEIQAAPDDNYDQYTQLSRNLANGTEYTLLVGMLSGPGTFAVSMDCPGTPSATMGVYFKTGATTEQKINSGVMIDMGVCDWNGASVVIKLRAETAANVVASSPSMTDPDFEYSPNTGWPRTVQPGQDHEITLSLPPGVAQAEEGPHTGQFSFVAGGQTFTINLKVVVNSGAFTPPTIALTAPINGAVYRQPTTIAIRATATPATGNTISRVEFSADTGNGYVLLGTDTTTPYSYSWDNPPAGTHKIKAQCFDNNGSSAYQWITILVRAPSDNDPPEPKDDAITVAANSIDNPIYVLPNDSDPEGDALTILSYTQPQFGTAFLENDIFYFTPEPNTYGTDGFTYTVQDGKGGTARAVVRVTINNVSPPTVDLTAPTGGTISFPAGAINIAANASDNVSVSKVEFYVNGVKIATDTTSPYSYAWNDYLAGTHVIQAVAYDNENTMGFSAPVTLKINQPPGNDRPVSKINNLPLQVLQDGSGKPATIREGVFKLRGTADDPADPGDAVRYRAQIYNTEGNLVQTTPWTQARVVGTPGNDLLMTLDLTTLRNGVYDLDLVVQDGTTAGGPFKPYDQAIDSTRFTLANELKIGRFTFSQEDFSIEVGDIPISLTRTYDSYNPNLGDFGYSWTYSLRDLDIELDEFRSDVQDLDDDWFSMRIGGSRDVTLTLPDGQRTTFTFNMVPGPCSGESDDPDFCMIPKWEAEPGITATLEPIQDTKLVCLGQMMWWTESAETSPENYDFSGFILTTEEGSKYYIEREDLGEHDFLSGYANGNYTHAYGEPRLTKIVLKTGDTIVFNRDQVDADGKSSFTIDHYESGASTKTSSIYFKRDTLGRIIAVYDPASLTAGVPSGPAIVEYFYDGESNLRQVSRLVKRDMSGAGAHVYETTTFEYNQPGFPHYITRVVDPRGIAPFINEYDATGRVSATTDAKNQRIEYIQETTPPAGGFKSPYAVGRHIVRAEPISDRTKFSDAVTEYDSHGNVVASFTQIDPAANPVLVGPVVKRKYNTAEAYPSSPTEPYNNMVREETIVLDHTATPQVQVTTYSRTYFTDGKVQTETISQYAIGAVGVLTDPIVTIVDYNQNGQTIATTDGKGYTSGNEYDPVTGAVLRTRHYSSRAAWLSDTTHTGGTLLLDVHYDGANRVQWSRDAMKNKTLNTYYTTAGPDGRPGDLLTVESFAYVDYTDNGIDDGVDILMNRTKFTYNANGRRKTEIHYKDASVNAFAAAITTQFEYDSQGRMIKTIDPLNGVAETIYENGRVARKIDRYGAESKSIYNAQGEVVQSESPDHAITRSVTIYDAQGQKKTITERPHFAGEPVYGTRATYDKAGRIIMVEELENLVINLEPQGTAFNTVFVSASVIPSSTTQTHYDDAGRIDYSIDAKGYQTSIEFDSHNRPRAKVNVVGPKTIKTITEYDANGNATSGYLMVNGTPQPANERTDFEYDEFNRRVKVTQPVTDKQGGGTERLYHYTKYDLAGRPTEQIDTEGNSTAYTYDGVGRVLSITNLAKVYDMSGATPVVSASSPADRAVTIYKYDDLGRITQQTDAKQAALNPFLQKRTTYEYDSLGRRTKRTLPEGQFELFTYDPIPGGQTKPIRQTTRQDFDASARKTTIFDFDEMGRTKKKTPDPAFSTTPIQFTYTATGKRATMSDAVGTTTYLFDNRDRPFKKISPLGTLTYGHDANGNLTAIASSNPQGVNLTYNYDVLNRLSTSHWGVDAGDTVNTYDDFGNLKNFTYPNGVKTEYNYDKAQRLTDMNITAVSGSATLATFNYNPSDRMLGRARERRAAVELIKTIANVTRVNRRVEYDYDGRYRLTRENITISEVGHTGDIVYDATPGYGDTTGFEANGNRRKRTVNSTLETALGGKLPTRTYVYNANDWLTSAGNTFDVNGNTLRGEVTPGITADDQAADDVYDFENRLARRTTGTAIYEIVYDGDGNRAKKIIRNAQGAIQNVVFYLVSELNPSGFVQVMEEFEASTAAIPAEASRSLTRRYGYGHDLLFQERWDTGTWKRNYYGYDGHSSVRFLCDANAEINDTYTYDAFGILIEDWHLNGATPNNYLYCGEQWDSDLGMYFLRARYLNPNTGRFWTMDGFEGDRSDPVSLHKYLYANANPVNLMDPSGNFTLCEFLVSTFIGVLVSAFVAPAISKAVENSWDRLVPKYVRDALNSVAPDCFMAGVAGEANFSRYGATLSGSVAVEGVWSLHNGNFAAFCIPGLGLGVGGRSGFAVCFYAGFLWNCEGSYDYQVPHVSLSFGKRVPAKVKQAVVKNLTERAIAVAAPAVLGTTGFGGADFPLSAENLAKLEEVAQGIKFDKYLNMLSCAISWAWGHTEFSVAIGYDPTGHAASARGGGTVSLSLNCPVQVYPSHPWSDDDVNVKFH